MNKGVIFAAVAAFALPIGFILCQSALTSSKSGASKPKSSGTLIYFYSPS